MPVRKITATTPYGVLTRKTHRTYTHVVVAIGVRPTELQARFAAGKAYYAKLAAKYRKVVESGDLGPACRGGSTLENYARWAAESEEAVLTSDERMARAMAENEIEIIENKIRTTTWAGRPDLAAKAANRLRSDGYFKVEIYAVDEEK